MYIIPVYDLNVTIVLPIEFSLHTCEMAASASWSVYTYNNRAIA